MLSHSFTLDGLIHCRTEQQAQKLLHELGKRFKECGLQLHPKKTRIVYCKDGNRKLNYPETSFDFLGYTFCRRICKNKKQNILFLSFNPAVSKAAMKSMRAKIRQLKWSGRTDWSLNELARKYNPILRGWINYYGKYFRSALYPVLRHFNKALVRWVMRKYKRFKGRRTRAGSFLIRIAKKESNLFAHWQIGMLGAFA